MTSLHSPSTLVNIAFVSLGRPLARTRRTASATAEPTDSPTPTGVIENAAIIAPRYRAAVDPGFSARGVSSRIVGMAGSSP